MNEVEIDRQNDAIVAPLDVLPKPEFQIGHCVDRADRGIQLDGRSLAVSVRRSTARWARAQSLVPEFAAVSFLQR